MTKPKPKLPAHLRFMGILIPKKMHAEIVKCAKAEGRSASKAANFLLREALDARAANQPQGEKP